MRIDLNCDIGESYGAYRIGCDDEMIAIASSVNIACGFHGGDPDVMAVTVERALQSGAAIGAHPGFPDLAGFGRREMRLQPSEVTNLIIYQIGALQAFVQAAGGRLHHVKPHGALYNMAAVDDELAAAVALAVKRVDPKLVLYALTGSRLVETARRLGLTVAREAFVDRAYRADGTLAPRNLSGAVITDPVTAGARAVTMVKTGCIPSIDGDPIRIDADTLCLHGDNPAAAAIAKAVRASLETAGIAVKAGFGTT
ncbi:5-oxoprolinase subunit PxpA [Heliobacterium undosum]|uniref:5-oxoprolinase subunit A n=1 Tax=Heliomicrobium undosum TaxID=121734 RepID=A0A845L0L9_9FIRM|nr:5-oxoprolinase subunit PxpA [Heliomicrobium undosum]MZP29126.1 5-oxoprolinase subunit PxpA [Heliomicrobium undosum]